MRWRVRRQAAGERTGTAPTRLSAGDLLEEALAGILQRPGRAALTALGTVLGVAAFVAILGLAATAGGQINQRFSVLAATEVLLEDTASDPALAGHAFPQDAEQRARALNGVREAGVFWRVPLANATVSAMPPHAGGDRGSEQLTVIAASPGMLRALRPRLAAGRLYDAFHERRSERVAVLGLAAARRLGITQVERQPAVFVAGIPLTVVGIIEAVDRQPDSLQAVLVPTSTAAALWGPPASGEPARMLIETQLGAAQLTGRQAPLAVRPDDPERLRAVVPPDPRTLREGVAGDLNALFLLLAAVLLVVGAVGIANTTLVAVLERVPEIGLRRALGARSRHVAAQFLTESTVLGTLGGLAGTSLGVATVVAVAALRRWTPLLEPWAVLPAPLAGTLIGALAGLYPAYRASRIQPVEALQR